MLQSLLVVRTTTLRKNDRTSMNTQTERAARHESVGDGDGDGDGEWMAFAPRRAAAVVTRRRLVRSVVPKKKLSDADVHSTRPYTG